MLKKGFLLKKKIRASLLSLSLPIIFIGCVQETVSNISPELKDTNLTKSTNQKIKTLKNISTSQNMQYISNVTLLPNIDENDEITYSNILDELALNIQNHIDMDISGSREIPTHSIEVEENWVEFTKKDEVIEMAKDYLGVPYVWAANGPSSFDCSGFTKYIYRNNGITIPRYSGHQANVGMEISFDELEKGDLVFFDTSKGFHRRVNHVGIYIGNNKFIHASSAQKKVVISSFDEKIFYKKRFLKGRRLIEDRSFAQYDDSQIIDDIPITNSI